MSQDFIERHGRRYLAAWLTTQKLGMDAVWLEGMPEFSPRYSKVVARGEVWFNTPNKTAAKAAKDAVT